MCSNNHVVVLVDAYVIANAYVCHQWVNNQDSLGKRVSSFVLGTIRQPLRMLPRFVVGKVHALPIITLISHSVQRDVDAVAMPLVIIAMAIVQWVLIQPFMNMAMTILYWCVRIMEKNLYISTGVLMVRVLANVMNIGNEPLVNLLMERVMNANMPDMIRNIIVRNVSTVWI